MAARDSQPPPEAMITRDQLRALNTLFRQAGITVRDDARVQVSSAIGRDIGLPRRAHRRRSRHRHQKPDRRRGGACKRGGAVLSVLVWAWFAAGVAVCAAAVLWLVLMCAGEWRGRRDG